MPTYITLIKWTDEGVKDAKNGFRRREQGRTAIENAGGRVIGQWFTQGRYDAITISEFPDDETASAIILANALGGRIRTETMRAFTPEEMQRIVDKIP